MEYLNVLKQCFERVANKRKLSKVAVEKWQLLVGDRRAS